MKKIVLVVASVLIAALIVGGLYAQNMAFRHQVKLLGLTNPLSSTGQNSLGLPWNRLPFINDAKDLLDDINAGSSPGNVLQVAQWQPDQDGFVGYTGTSGSPFLLDSCEAVLVQLTNDVDYRMVGSHNPSKGCTLLALGSVTTEATSQESASGQNFFNFPYHGTAGDAKDLIDELNAYAGAPVVLQIAEWQTDLDGFVGYTGTSGSPFQLRSGQGYLMQVSADVIDYVPSHF